MIAQRVSRFVNHHRGWGLALSAACLAVAVTLQLLLGFSLAHMLFYPAIMLCAFLGGGMAGYASVAIAAAAAWYLYVPEQFRWSNPPTEHLIGLLAFAAMGCLIVAITNSLSRTLFIADSERSKAEEAQAEAIKARDLAERAQREAEQLMSEMDHRAKNEYTLIEAIALAVTPRTRAGRAVFQEFSSRLQALARSSSLLTQALQDGVGVHALVSAQIGPFCPVDRADISGPPLALSSSACRYLGMALHELGTNAAKYGSLSQEAGRVSLQWRIENGDRFVFNWSEVGGPCVSEPSRVGFGRTVLTRLVPEAVDGEVNLAFGRGGVSWQLSAPVAMVLMPPDHERLNLSGVFMISPSFSQPRQDQA